MGTLGCGDAPRLKVSSTGDRDGDMVADDMPEDEVVEHEEEGEGTRWRELNPNACALSFSR